MMKEFCDNSYLEDLHITRKNMIRYIIKLKDKAQADGRKVSKFDWPQLLTEKRKKNVQSSRPNDSKRFIRKFRRN